MDVKKSESEREREIAKELLREKLGQENYHEEVQKWLVDKLEKYTYNNYKYCKRKMSYIEYITQLYINDKGIKAIKSKYEKLLFDLRKTQTRLYQKKNVVIKKGTRAWAALHLPPPTMATGDGGFLELRDEIGVAKPIWDDVYHGIYVKVSYIKKLI